MTWGAKQPRPAITARDQDVIIADIQVVLRKHGLGASTLVKMIRLAGQRMGR